MRVVLETLGTEDYGIYNLVGGVVVFFTFLNASMTTATQRFLNYYLGRGDTEYARNVYSISLIVHAIIALIVVILAQTIGLWFFYNCLNLPQERKEAALIVYQFSVVAVVVKIFMVPYVSSIISYEKMSFFAMLSIFQEALRLGMVFMLQVISFDKLMVYAFLVCIADATIFMVHKIYCNITFEIARFRYCCDKKMFRQFLVFSGWTLFGSLASVSREQGINILINNFYGVAVNAALGVAAQVNTAVYQFVSNFQTAFNPQIVKSYSLKDYDYFMQLIFWTSKISFCLLFIFVLPLYINADFVLQIWLHNLPEYIVEFTRVNLISSLIVAIAGPLGMSVQATGSVRKYQIVVSCFMLASLPLSLLFLLMDYSPVYVLIVRTGLDLLLLIWRMFYLVDKINFKIIDFFIHVIVPICIIALISSFVTAVFHGFFIRWTGLMVSCAVSTLSVCCLMYLIGLNKRERIFMQSWIRKHMLILIGRRA